MTYKNKEDRNAYYRNYLAIPENKEKNLQLQRINYWRKLAQKFSPKKDFTDYTLFDLRNFVIAKRNLANKES